MRELTTGELLVIKAQQWFGYDMFISLLSGHVAVRTVTQISSSDFDLLLSQAVSCMRMGGDYANKVMCFNDAVDELVSLGTIQSETAEAFYTYTYQTITAIFNEKMDILQQLVTGYQQATSETQLREFLTCERDFSMLG